MSIRTKDIASFGQLYLQKGKWQGKQLVGSIYGVALGGLFAGESMFHRESNASKVALFHLTQHLRERNFALFDIQMLTPITRQLGAVEISREEYLKRLTEAVKRPCAFKTCQS